MRHRLVPCNNLAINTAIIKYFEVPQTKKVDYSDPDHDTLEHMRDAIKQKLKEKYPLAKTTGINDFLYILFQQVVKEEQIGDELFSYISPSDRSPMLATLFVKNYGLGKICKEINDYFYDSDINANRQIGKITVATIVTLEKTCFLEAELNGNISEEEFAEVIKQIIPPTQWQKLLKYAINTLNPVLCCALRNHFALSEKEQAKLDAALVAGKLMEMS